MSSLPPQPASSGPRGESLQPCLPRPTQPPELRVQRAAGHASEQLRLCAACGWPVGHLSLSALSGGCRRLRERGTGSVRSLSPTCFLCSFPISLTLSSSVTITSSHHDILYHTHTVTPDHHTRGRSHGYTQRLVHMTTTRSRAPVRPCILRSWHNVRASFCSLPCHGQDLAVTGACLPEITAWGTDINQQPLHSGDRGRQGGPPLPAEPRRERGKAGEQSGVSSRRTLPP